MIIRPTARLILLDPDRRVLLFRIEDRLLFDPNNPDRPTVFWIAPGGGVEAGETFEDAARRELGEETGLAATLGPCVLECDQRLRQAEHDIVFRIQFFLARTETIDLTLDGLNDQERDVYRDHRWWTLEDIERTSEAIFPEELAALLRDGLAVP